MTITLRPAEPRDVAWLDTWFPAAASALGYPQTAVADLFVRVTKEQDLHLRMILRDDAAVGLVVYSVPTVARAFQPARTPRPTLTSRSAKFELIATPKAHARMGAGMAAAALAEEEMRAAGADVVFAPAAAINGISMYFWIRLGYAPAPHPEWPCHPEGVAWLCRKVNQ